MPPENQYQSYGNIRKMTIVKSAIDVTDSRNRMRNNSCPELIIARGRTPGETPLD